MTVERYTELLNNPNVQKVNDVGGGMALYEPDRQIMHYTFMHRGHPGNPADDRTRLLFNLFPLDQLTAGIPVPAPVGNDTLVMVNSHELLYAMTFRIRIDSATRTASMRVEDLPELGDALVTDDENNGITINY